MVANIHKFPAICLFPLLLAACSMIKNDLTVNLYIDSDIKSAQVLLNGKPVGKVPYTLRDLEFGEYTVTVVAPQNAVRRQKGSQRLKIDAVYRDAMTGPAQPVYIPLHPEIYLENRWQAEAEVQRRLENLLQEAKRDLSRNDIEGYRVQLEKARGLVPADAGIKTSWQDWQQPLEQKIEQLLQSNRLDEVDKALSLYETNTAFQPALALGYKERYQSLKNTEAKTEKLAELHETAGRMVSEGELVEAVRTYENIIALDPENVEAQKQITSLLERQQTNIQMALSRGNTQEAERQLATYKQMTQGMPSGKKEVRKLEQQLRTLKTAEAKQERIDDLLAQAQQQEQVGEALEAAALYQEVLKLEGGQPQAKQRMSQLVERQKAQLEHTLAKGDIQSAEQQLQQYKKMTQGLAEKESAVVLLERQLQGLKTAQAKTERIDGLLAQAQQQEQAGEALKAATLYQEVLKLDPHRKEARQQLEKLQVQINSERKNKSPADTSTDPYTGMEFVYVKPGCFQMGSPASDKRRYDSETRHRVCLTEGYYLGKYEVTQVQWRKVMGGNPSRFSNCGGRCPVEQVSWNDVQEFIQKLNRQTGREYRLPTEAEWEYACRSSGKNQKYCGGDDPDQVAWYWRNANGSSHPVGQKQPNGLGIYDMSGNVYEFVQDWFGDDYYRSSPVNNPKGPSSGSQRMSRGGGWNHGEERTRSAGRRSSTPDFSTGYIGFRLARTR